MLGTLSLSATTTHCGWPKCPSKQRVLSPAPARQQLRQQRSLCHSSSLAQKQAGWRCQAAPSDDVQPIQDVMLPQLSAEALHEEQEWLAGSVCLWLDEEWAPLEEHKELGAAVSRAYGRLRAAGNHDVTDVLLGMSGDLMQSFDFKPTFVNAFEVANKVSELLMMRHMGEANCCTTEADRERYARYSQSATNGTGNGSGAH